MIQVMAITYKIGEKVFLYTLNKLLNVGYAIKDVHHTILNSGLGLIEILLRVFDK